LSIDFAKNFQLTFITLARSIAPLAISSVIIAISRAVTDRGRAAHVAAAGTRVTAATR
jgi:hypothetical protein